MGALEFWLPCPPDNANNREHWAVANRKKREYMAELEQRRLMRHGFPALPPKPLLRARLDVVWHYPNRRHLLDDDNATRRLKPVRDYLVLAGYLVNDATANIEATPIAIAIGQPTPPLCSVRLTLTPIDTP